MLPVPPVPVPMLSPSPCALLHAHLGAPPVDGCVVAPGGALCWVCAGPAARGVPRQDWTGASYTGQNKVRCPSSAWVCEPCVYLHSRNAPVPGRPPAQGKKMGGNFRNYSHLFEQLPRGESLYTNASKAEKPTILFFLRRPKLGTWFAAIADSGQKHVLPWAPINGQCVRGRVLFDETVVELPDRAGWAIVDETAALLTAGATKEEIGSGEYGAGAWQRCPSAIRAFEARWGAQRHGAWFTLALWLAQRDEAAVAKRQDAERDAAAVKKGAPRGARRSDEREAQDEDCGGAARDARGLPRGGGEPAQALGAAPGPDAQRGAAVADAGGVGDGARQGAPASRPQQLGFPGFG